MSKYADIYVGTHRESYSELILHHTESGLRIPLGSLIAEIERNLIKWKTINSVTLTGSERIDRERRRQIEQEGWTPEHDEEHTGGELLKAAMCYALGHGQCHDPAEPPHPWPWAEGWWKPSDDPIRNLEKAGALIAAEIDRLQKEKT